MKKKIHKNIGSDFDDFLREEGILESSEAVASKRTVAFQLLKAMEKSHFTKTQMASKMHTSRSEYLGLSGMQEQGVVTPCSPSCRCASMAILSET